MNTELLAIFVAIYEKQDTLSKLTSKEIIHEYGYSEIHCIDYIGTIDTPNVTKIAKTMNMTRGAISKITKKLLEKGDIETFSKENNKKEIYFKLTSKGQKLFLEHQKRHQAWLARDQQFLNQYSTEMIAFIQEFLSAFDQYLFNQIEELSSKEEK